MPTLAELKDRWFIKMDGSAPDGVPSRRHTDPGGPYSLAVSSDGNSVTPLIDGKDFMTAWHNAVLDLHGVAGAEIYLTAWRLEGVKTLGESQPHSDALKMIDAADEQGVSVRILLSQHLQGLRYVSLLPHPEWSLPTPEWLLLHGVLAMLDNRYPAAGTNHSKYTVFKSPSSAVALLGSIDISKSRWDDTAHLSDNPERPPRGPTQGNPTHDIGVLVSGPVIRDLELAFRERWNDPGYSPIFPDINTTVSTPTVTGTHSIQVLRTYGIAEDLAYTWSPRGEFTVWASYLNAIKRATTYIYIEDQYFLPFDWPPTFGAKKLARDTDLFYQLGEAMRRGVRILVLTPTNAEDLGKEMSKYQRDVGINYLRKVKADGAPGDVVVASLQNGSEDVYVHSKLMIVDDELVLIGSANFGQRSMTCDGEVQLAIVDANNALARELRIALWSEHRGVTWSMDLEDPVGAYEILKANIADRIGHLQPYTLDEKAVYPEIDGSKPPDWIHSAWMERAFDPYYGPKKIRLGG